MDLRELKQKTEGTRHPWEFARLAVTEKLLAPILASAQAPLILDIGCGDSFVVEGLSKRFSQAEYWAIDTAFTAEMLDFYREKYSNQSIHFADSLENAAPQIQRPVNLVLLMDVIEHIEEDIAFLKQVLSMPFITKDTYFFITVPAYQSLFCSHDVFLGHYRRYDNKLLKQHIQAAGLKEEKIGYFFSSLILPRILQVAKEKLSPPKQESTGLVDWKGGKTLTSLIQNALIADFQFTSSLEKVGISLPGLSNYVLCRPSAS